MIHTINMVHGVFCQKALRILYMRIIFFHICIVHMYSNDLCQLVLYYPYNLFKTDVLISLYSTVLRFYFDQQIFFVSTNSS